MLHHWISLTCCTSFKREAKPNPPEPQATTVSLPRVDPSSLHGSTFEPTNRPANHHQHCERAEISSLFLRSLSKSKGAIRPRQIRCYFTRWKHSRSATRPSTCAPRVSTGPNTDRSLAASPERNPAQFCTIFPSPAASTPSRAVQSCRHRAASSTASQISHLHYASPLFRNTTFTPPTHIRIAHQRSDERPTRSLVGLPLPCRPQFVRYANRPER